MGSPRNLRLGVGGSREKRKIFPRYHNGLKVSFSSSEGGERGRNYHLIKKERGSTKKTGALFLVLRGGRRSFPSLPRKKNMTKGGGMG